MALPATVSHTTCALPPRRRRERHSTSTPTPRHLNTALSLRAAPPPTALDRALSDLESNPRLLTPDLLAALIAAFPRHPSPRRRLARLRRLFPVSLLRRHPTIALRLLHLHASLGLVSYAHHLFDHLLPARARADDAFPWNCLVAGYARLGRHGDALALYLQMDEERVPRDRFTFTSALDACAGVGSLALGQAVHRDAVRAGLASDASVCDALVDMYAKCGDIQRALRVFDAMPEKDEVSWNILLAGCLWHGLSHQSMEIWRRMLREGRKPDSATLSTLLSMLPLPCDNGKQGLEIHAWAIRHGLETELSLANALIRMYSDKNKPGYALSVFESMTARDLLSWNAVISAHRHDHRILMMFRRMVDSGMRPDAVIFATVLSACDDLGLVEGAMRLFSEMKSNHGEYAR